jgi:hypothetical protein
MKKLIAHRLFDPILIILVSLITFAPQLHLLGFRMDDWVYIDFYAFRGLDSLITYTFLIDSRPFAFWVPWIGFQPFCNSPLPWQYWTLGWNILATLMVWRAALMPRPASARNEVNLLAVLVVVVLLPIFWRMYGRLVSDGTRRFKKVSAPRVGWSTCHLLKLPPLRLNGSLLSI